MKRSMKPLDVELNEGGEITISQQDGADDPYYITISVDQVPVVISWLNEMVAEHAKAEEAKA